MDPVDACGVPHLWIVWWGGHQSHSWEKVRGRLSLTRSICCSQIDRREGTRDRGVRRRVLVDPRKFARGAKVHFTANWAKIDDKDLNFPTRGDSQTRSLWIWKLRRTLITKVKRGERWRKPSAPFTNLDPCNRRLRAAWLHCARRTMAFRHGTVRRGQEVGNGGTTGLITYMYRFN